MGSIRSGAPLLLALVCIVATVIASPIPEESAPEAVRETLETLNLETPSHDESERDKRTIGFLRNLFPGISEIIDRKIQSLTRLIFRLVGRLVLGGGGGDSRSSSSASSGGGSRRISITLPTFPPSLDDEEEESQTEQESTSDPSLEDNLAGSESRVNEVRVPYEGDQAELDEEDQEAAATGDEESQAVARSEDTAEGDNEAAASDTSDRDKRFLFFGGGDSSSSSGGGSGNFLFDIIRNAADTSARTVGRLYRVIAGTDLSASSNSTIVVRSGAQKSTTLITGSGSTDSTDDAAASTGGDGASAGLKASAAVDGGDGSASVGASAGTPAVDPNDGYTSGIPGPLTRLFIIANRGISNLLQDLILRLSQTSERIVNFKARLITALI